MALTKFAAALGNYAVVKREQHADFGDADGFKGGTGSGIAVQALDGLARHFLQAGFGGGRVELFEV